MLRRTHDSSNAAQAGVVLLVTLSAQPQTSRSRISMRAVLHVASKTQPGHGEALAVTVTIAAHGDRRANMPVLTMLGLGATGYWTSFSSDLFISAVRAFLSTSSEGYRAAGAVIALCRFLAQARISSRNRGVCRRSQEKDLAASVVIALFAVCLPASHLISCLIFLLL